MPDPILPVLFTSGVFPGEVPGWQCALWLFLGEEGAVGRGFHTPWICEMQTFSVLTKLRPAGSFSQRRKLRLVPMPGGHTGGWKCSVHAPAEDGGVSPGQGMVLELFPEICSTVQVDAPKSISLRGADLLVPVVRAECPSGDLISSALLPG